MITRIALSESCEFILDGTHGSPERVDEGIPVLSAQNITNGELNFMTDRFTTESEYDAFRRRLEINKGDVLLTIVGTIGRAAVVVESKPLVFQRSVAVLRPKRALLDSRFLFHTTQSINFRNQLTKATNQSSQAGVYLGKLGKVEIPLPSLTEQRRIAAILDQAEALRAKRRYTLAQLDTLTQSLFLDLFGDPDTNPKEWPRIEIGRVAHLQGGFAFESASYTQDGIRLVKISNVHFEKLIWDDVSYVPFSYIESHADFALAQGDIVLSLTRPIIKSLNNVKVARVSANDLPVLLNQRVGRFILDPARIDSQFLLHYCYTSSFKRKIASYCSESLQPECKHKAD